MAGRILLAALFSAIAMFFWGFVYWGLSGATEQLLSPLPQSAQDDIAAVLRRDKVPSGMYVYPMPANSSDAELVKEAEELHLAGPRFLLAHRLEGSPMMAPGVMLAGFAHMFGISLLVAGMTAWALPVLDSFAKRFGFVLFVCLLGVLWSNPGDVIWWLHSPAFFLGKAIYGIVSGVLLGIVIGGVVKPVAAVSEAG